MNKRLGRPRHITCYDNGIILLTNLGPDFFFYIKDNKIIKSDRLPILGKPCSYFSLSEIEKEKLSAHYDNLWGN